MLNQCIIACLSNFEDYKKIIIFDCLSYWSPFWPIVSAVFSVANSIFQTSHALFMQKKNFAWLVYYCFFHAVYSFLKKGHIFILSKHNYDKIPRLLIIFCQLKSEFKRKLWSEKKQIMFNRWITIDDDSNMSQSGLVNIKICIYVWWI